jgi:hypothetical protein
MIQDDLIVRLGRAQQKVMSLSVRCRHLEMAELRARERAEILEELVMDIVADIKEIVPSTEILERIRKVIEKLDEDQADD